VDRDAQPRPTSPAYPPALLARIAALCEADPGREACGLVLRRGGALEVVPVPNVADRAHAEDPARFPRGAREAFAMDPAALLAVHERNDREGGAIAAVWHSHVEAEAALSAQDRADAFAGGDPVLPGAEHLVLSVRGGRVAEVRRYRVVRGTLVEAPVDGP
jgi:proteasome lid subunit RPN8/RPN11